MTRNFRTLLLLGFTALVGASSGCIVETTSSPGSGSQSCLDSQYFIVQWGVDHGPGTIPLSCDALSAMGSAVVLTTDAPAPYTVLRAMYNITCTPNATCSDGSPCNSQGVTGSGIPAGTNIVMADLVDANNTSLSTADSPGVPMPSCRPLIVGFPFTVQ